MHIKFRDTEEVHQFLELGGDAWCMPMVEEYVGMCDPEEDLDVTELNQWIKLEHGSLTREYEQFLDNG
tara:strand:+ start:337 stop:540 length:204 start_codon:yes stop_codon:yes gene_type:complete